VQSNAIGEAIHNAVGSSAILDTAVGSVSYTKLIVASGTVLILAFIIFGGVKRIAHFTQIVVPFMALGYVLMALLIIIMNIAEMPRIIALIFTDAWTPMAGLGAAIGWGVMRGVYSNEAGQGSGPHAAAAAEVQHPAQQGLVQAFSVYIDTLFICSATAFMILLSGTYYVEGIDAAVSGGTLATDVAINSPAFTQFAVESAVGGFGKVFVAVALFFFAFTTLLAYYYIAETNVAFIRRSFRFPGELILIKLMLLGAVFFGTVREANLAWDLGNIGVGVMAWLNIVGILILFFMAKPAVKALRDYERQRKAGVTEYTFDPEALGIKNADFWKK
jgi:AGCS family alanine or glycine:cation symporter